MATNLLELSNVKAKAHFMDPQFYGSTDLPRYFDFTTVLTTAERALKKHPLSNDLFSAASNIEGVNYTLVDNKDGKYAWRPLQFVHPYLYADLVRILTTKDNWRFLTNRFAEFSKLEHIRCASLPIVGEKKKKFKAEQILNWWSGFEQESLILSLRYRMMFITDITDCYGSIYTHSIAWALHGKDVAKDRNLRDDMTLLGNVIDKRIRAMRFGQTNGIPQGSGLMDLIAEMVLGYVDEQLDAKLKNEPLGDYYILRYRDDYRIFVNDSSSGERILKELTIILSGMGMRVNSGKTKVSSDVVRDSVKPDKMAWLAIENNFKTLSLEKKLLLAYRHADQFPNCGCIMRPLAELHRDFDEFKVVGVEQIKACASIMAEMAYRNPRCCHICMALVAKLIHCLDIAGRKEVASRIFEKFGSLPNTGYLQVWLQRISLPCCMKLRFEEKMCEVVEDPLVDIWEERWLEGNIALREELASARIVNRDEIEKLDPTMRDDEVNAFIDHYQEGYLG